MRPFSNLFNVAASRPAKSPRGPYMGIFNALPAPFLSIAQLTVAGRATYRRPDAEGAEMKNRRVILTSRPKGVAQAENFAIVEEDIAPLQEGEFRVRNDFLSVDPAMRGWIADAAGYSEPVAIGATMRSGAVGEIVESRHPDFAVGEVVNGMFGWQTYAAVGAAAVTRRVRETDLPRSLALGVLGINGVTALIGLDLIGEPKSGETVLVSTAAGSVGSAVGQIAKLRGCRTVGDRRRPRKGRRLPRTVRL